MPMVPSGPQLRIRQVVPQLLSQKLYRVLIDEQASVDHGPVGKFHLHLY
jgi:hypothetical protein